MESSGQSTGPGVMDVASGPSLATWFLITYISKGRGQSAMWKILDVGVYGIFKKSSAITMILLMFADKVAFFPPEK